MYIQQQQADNSSTALEHQLQSTTMACAQADIEVSSNECLLCGKTDSQKSRLSSWRELERTYLIHHFSSAPSKSCMICKKHLLEAKRHCHSLDHTPSWRNKNKNLYIPVKNVLILNVLNRIKT